MLLQLDTILSKIKIYKFNTMKENLEKKTDNAFLRYVLSDYVDSIWMRWWGVARYGPQIGPCNLLPAQWQLNCKSSTANERPWWTIFSQRNGNGILFGARIQLSRRRGLEGDSKGTRWDRFFSPLRQLEGTSAFPANNGNLWKACPSFLCAKPAKGDSTIRGQVVFAFRKYPGPCCHATQLSRP